MKKLSMIALLVLLTIVPLSSASAAEDSKRVITVTGHAETSVAPDLAIATFGVLTTNEDVDTAKKENDRVMQKIHEAMLITGIDRSKIKTSMFSVQPTYRQETTPGSENITGYRVQNTIAVTIEDMRNISRVIDAAFAAGANQFQGIQFGVKKEQTLRDELLKQALLDGKRKADLIANTLGETLGRPSSISESGHISPVMMDSVRFSKAMSANSTTPIAAGSMAASVDVHMIFELQ